MHARRPKNDGAVADLEGDAGCSCCLERWHVLGGILQQQQRPRGSTNAALGSKTQLLRLHPVCSTPIYGATMAVPEAVSIGATSSSQQ